MSSTSVLAEGQFGGKRQKRVDPHTIDMLGPQFSGQPGGSKTMTIAGGHLPPPQAKHKHHRKAGKRSHRAH